MSRQALPANQLKTAKVNIAMTQLEYAKLYYIAEALGLKPQEFVRTAINITYDGIMDAEKEERKNA